MFLPEEKEKEQKAEKSLVWGLHLKQASDADLRALQVSLPLLGQSFSLLVFQFGLQSKSTLFMLQPWEPVGCWGLASKDTCSALPGLACPACFLQVGSPSVS